MYRPCHLTNPTNQILQMAKKLQQWFCLSWQRRHWLITSWKCQKTVPILRHETKALLELFCFQLIVFSSAFASWGKIKYMILHGRIRSGLMISKKFADQSWIGFNFIGSWLDSDQKISQSAHLWLSAKISLPQTLSVRKSVLNILFEMSRFRIVLFKILTEMESALSYKDCDI